MNAEHTATPWHLNIDSDVMAIHDGIVTCVANTYTHQSIGRMNAERDAEFIVQACNAHDDLVKALREIIADDAHGFPVASIGSHLKDQARAALAKAGAA